jgi:1-acyl-sn-glycerol-3-phosphate acyltransferase
VTPATLLRTVLGSVTIVLDTLVFATAAIVGGALLGPTHPWVNGMYRGFARVALLGCGVRLRSNGDAHLDPSRRFVFVSNHASNLDPIAILAALPRHAVRFVAKQELARLPLFGAALRATGNVIVARSDTRRDLAALQGAEAGLARVSVLFFAEGTRSRSGELGPFKKGAAAFALRNRMPLVPIGVAGAFEILPRGFEVRGPGTVAVSVGEPIELDGRGFEARAELTETLRAAVAREVERARRLRAGS